MGIMERERHAAKGRLMELEEEARNLRLSIKGDIAAVRSMLDPYGDEAELNIAAAAQQNLDAYKKQKRLNELLAKIKGIKRDLGED